MRAQIRIAQGNGREALRDCLHLVGREAAWVWSGCSAQAYAISGRLPDAQRLLATNLRGQELQGTRGAWVAGIMAQLAAQTGDHAVEFMNERAEFVGSSQRHMDVELAARDRLGGGAQLIDRFADGAADEDG